MRHFIIVKFKKEYNYKDELDNIKNLFNEAMVIPEIKDIIIHNSNSSKDNRHDLMIEMILTINGLQDFDNSEVHRQWKEVYGKHIESKTIFDCE